MSQSYLWEFLAMAPERVADILLDVISVFANETICERTITVYARTLCGLDEYALKSACDEWLKTGDHFPYPSELISLCDRLRQPALTTDADK